MTAETHPPAPEPVLLAGELPAGALEALLTRWGLAVAWVAEGEEIPGSYWGAPEAGLVASTLLVRPDTPVHSALHETCHLIAMDAGRRAVAHTDAGGEEIEECGVCYLQILLGDHLPGASAARICRDMDAWGYSFRLGSTAEWFGADAEDARQWLIDHGLLTRTGEPTWKARREAEPAAGSAASAPSPLCTRQSAA